MEWPDRHRYDGEFRNGKIEGFVYTYTHAIEYVIVYVFRIAIRMLNLTYSPNQIKIPYMHGNLTCKNS